MKSFPGKVIGGEAEEALAVAKAWKGGARIQADGSRLDDGRVGAAVVWREEHIPRPSEGQREGAFRPPYHPRAQPTGWTGCRCHLGDNKEVFDAEIFALYQALKMFEARNEEGASYTVFSDSTAAFPRAISDRIGPGQTSPRPSLMWRSGW